MTTNLLNTEDVLHSIEVLDWIYSYLNKPLLEKILDTKSWGDEFEVNRIWNRFQESSYSGLASLDIHNKRKLIRYVLSQIQ